MEKAGDEFKPRKKLHKMLKALFSRCWLYENAL